MCKVFAMTSLSKVRVDKKFLEVVRDAVCIQGNDDGFGYAVLATDGTLSGERTVLPSEFTALKETSPKHKTPKLSIVTVTQNSFGDLKKSIPKAFIGHGRMSTNHVSLENTHPFVSKDTALIHNGVVSDEFRVINDLSTSCDTEILLKLWDKTGMDGIEAHASGYYAIAVLTRDGLLHIARDDRAPLWIAYSKTVDSYLIATTPGIVQEVARRMKWRLETPEMVSDNTYAVFNGNTVVLKRSINPLGWSQGIDHSKVGASLGYNDTGYMDEYAAEETRLNDDSPISEEDLDRLYQKRWKS